MYLLASLFNFDMNAVQPILRWIVVILCLSSAGVLFCYKRGKSKFRFFPSLFAYSLMLAMISDPILVFIGQPKIIDCTEIIGRSFILAVLVAHKGNVMGAFRNAQYPKILTYWKRHKGDDKCN